MSEIEAIRSYVDDWRAGVLSANEAMVAIQVLFKAATPDLCKHEWIDIRNSVVESGEMCRHCSIWIAGNVHTDQPSK
jgi:hypothetical protein